HGELDEICSCTLHWSVDGGAFRRLTALAVGGVDVNHEQAAPEHGLHVALGARVLSGPLHVLRNTRMAREVTIHVLLGGSALYSELRCEPKRRHPVDQPEIDDL